MKTRHDFQVGDLIRHGDRSGHVAAREIKRKRDEVTIRWDDGAEEKGLHHKLWMCERAENPSG